MTCSQGIRMQQAISEQVEDLASRPRKCIRESFSFAVLRVRGTFTTTWHAQGLAMRLHIGGTRLAAMHAVKGPDLIICFKFLCLRNSGEASEKNRCDACGGRSWIRRHGEEDQQGSLLVEALYVLSVLKGFCSSVSFLDTRLCSATSLSGAA